MESHSLNLPQWAVDISQELMLRVGHDGAILATNPACARVLGYSDPQLHSQSFLDFVHPEDSERTQQALASAAEGTRRAFDNRVRHQDGDYRSIAWVAASHGPDLYVTGLDLTAEKHALESLRQSTRIESLGQLTRGIVHDFNNSLQNIVAALELIRKLLSAGRGDEAERFIASALGSGQRAAALNERLLGFAGPGRSGARPMSINDVSVGMADMLRRALPHPVRLVVEPAPNLWASHCDVEEAQGVVLNLVIHARDAIPDGGIITIKTCNSEDAGRVTAHAASVPPGAYACLVINHARDPLQPQAKDRAPAAMDRGDPSGSARLVVAAQFARANGGDAKLYVDAAGAGTVIVYLPRYTGPGSP